MAKRKSDNILNSLGPSLFGGEDKFKQTPNNMEPEKIVEKTENAAEQTIEHVEKQATIKNEDDNDKQEKLLEKIESVSSKDSPDPIEKPKNKQGTKIPKARNKKKEDTGYHTTTATFSKATYKKMKLISLEYDVSLKDIITECVEEGIKKYKI